MDIREGNILIAKFLGAKKTGSATGLTKGGVAYEYSVKVTSEITATFYDKEGAWTDFYEMQFHSSWDWLMPVVDKIEGLGYNFRVNSYHETKTVHCNFYKQLSDMLTDNETYKNKKDAVYNTIIEFINLYNTNKK